MSQSKIIDYEIGRYSSLLPSTAKHAAKAKVAAVLKKAEEEANNHFLLVFYDSTCKAVEGAYEFSGTGTTFANFRKVAKAVSALTEFAKSGTKDCMAKTDVEKLYKRLKADLPERFLLAVSEQFNIDEEMPEVQQSVYRCRVGFDRRQMPEAGAEIIADCQHVGFSQPGGSSRYALALRFEVGGAHLRRRHDCLVAPGARGKIGMAQNGHQFGEPQ